MNIFIINVTAQYGSTGKIAQILRNGYENQGNHVTICYGRKKTELTSKGNYYRISNSLETIITYLGARLFGIQGLGCYFSTKKLLKYINKNNPDLIHILNLHGYYIDEFMLLRFLKSHQTPIIYTMCDEYSFTGKCGFAGDCDKFMSSCKGCNHKKYYPTSLFFNTSYFYFEKKSDIYKGYGPIVFAGCGYVAQRARASLLLKEKDVRTIGEPVDMDNVFYPRNVEELRNRLGISPDKIVVLTVAVLSNSRKGGSFFLQMTKRLVKDEQFVFIYVGYDTDKYDDLTPAEVIRIPYVESLDELATYFSLADVTVATSLSETVPLAVINSLACGTPVCAFNIGGLSSISVNDESILKKVQLYNVAELCGVIEGAKKKTDKDIRKNRLAVYNDFSSVNVIKDYNNIANQLVMK